MPILSSSLRNDFPVLKRSKIIYLDNACMTLRPKQVIEAINWYYKTNCACAGRSFHKQSEELNERVAKARETIKGFFKASKSHEIVFTKNTTEGINTVAFGFNLRRGDLVVTSDREHNSNLIPWLVLKKRGIKHIAVPSTENFEFDLEAMHEAMSKKVKIVSVVHISNIDGYELPIKEIIKLSHDFGAKVLIDGAQSAGHIPLNLKKLDADFFAASSHKACGPIIGCLLIKEELLEQVKPLMYGGGTVANATLNSFELLAKHERFEAGLQDYASIIGFGEACKYLNKIGMEKIEQHDRTLTKKLMKRLVDINGVTIVGVNDWRKCTSIVSFNIEGFSPHDVALMLDEAHSIAVRSGKHCAHAWFNKYCKSGCVRASTFLYNQMDEINILVEEVSKIAELLEK